MLQFNYELTLYTKYQWC